MRRPWMWTILMFVGMFILLSMVQITLSAYDRAEIRAEADRRWCPLWTIILDEGPEPKNRRQARLKREMERLRAEMGCRRGGTT